MEEKLHPNWVTGFTDAEGSFMINMSKSSFNRTGWQLYPCFQIKLHIRDISLLQEIKSFFGDIGTITFNKNVAVIYRIQNLKDIINVVIPHFDKYSLITNKYNDYILFKNIIELINKDEHLNINGLSKIINLKALLNRGLSDKLKKYFPNVIKLNKSCVKIPDNIDLNWIAGFYSGECCFLIRILKSKTNKIGYTVQLKIVLTQHSKDELLMNNIKNTLNCGCLYKYSNKNAIDLVISDLEVIINNIIPILKEYKILGVKLLDFEDFCKVGNIMKRKGHLTLLGLEEIRLIKSSMNRARYASKFKL